MMVKKIYLSADILRKKYKIQKKYLCLPLLLTIIFLLNKKYFVLGVLTIASGIFSFYHDKYNRTPLDIKLALFLGIMITREYGFVFTLIFFVLSDTIPSFLGGGHLEGADMIFLLWYFIINAVVLLFPETQIIGLGITLVVIEFIGSILIKTFFGYPGIVAFVSSIMTVLVRIVYFLTLGPVLNLIFGLL